MTWCLLAISLYTTAGKHVLGICVGSYFATERSCSALLAPLQQLLALLAPPESALATCGLLWSLGVDIDGIR